MRSAPSEDVLPETESADEPPRRHAPARVAPPAPVATPEPPPPAFATAANDALFTPAPPRCDVCDVVLADDDAGGEGAPGGHGLYIWVRGGEVVYEEPPLCMSCAAAITISALRQWDEEDDEG